jgi:hypothetical protein
MVLFELCHRIESLSTALFHGSGRADAEYCFINQGHLEGKRGLVAYVCSTAY